jgi:hypothetical protein
VAKTFTLIGALAFLLGFAILGNVWKWGECRKVGHSIAYCLVTH